VAGGRALSLVGNLVLRASAGMEPLNTAALAGSIL